MPTRCLSRRQWASDVSSIRWPPKVILPASGFTRPLRQRISVLLPEPLGPITTSRSPVEIAQLTSSSARIRPNAFTRFCASISGVSLDCMSALRNHAGTRRRLLSRALLEAARGRNGAVARLLEALFEVSRQPSKRGTDGKVNHQREPVDQKRRAVPRLHGRALNYDLGDAKELVDADQRRQRCRLHERRAEASHGRQDRHQCLGQNNIAIDLPSLETQRRGADKLVPADRIDAAPHDLGAIGATPQREAEQCGGEGLQWYPDKGRTEIDEEQVHQQRDVSPELDIAERSDAQRAPLRDAHKTDQDRDDDRTDQRQQRESDGELETGQEETKIIEEQCHTPHSVRNGRCSTHSARRTVHDKLSTSPR